MSITALNLRTAFNDERIEHAHDSCTASGLAAARLQARDKALLVIVLVLDEPMSETAPTAASSDSVAPRKEPQFYAGNTGDGRASTPRTGRRKTRSTEDDVFGG